MESYASTADYAALFPDGEIDDAALAEASRVVDRLTFGRIPAAGGIGALTDRQRELVVEAACRQACFITGNSASDWSWAVASYSINGVSVKAGHGEGVRYYGGVAVPGEVVMLLDETGLTTRLAGGVA